MHKLTIILFCAAVFLSIATGISMWHLVSAEDVAVQPAVEGAQIALGVPNLATSTETTPLSAQNALLWDSTQQRVLYDVRAFEQRPIASITKLMTAMVALDHGIPWEDTTTIELPEYVAGGNLLLHAGETVRMRDLFAASLIGSANNATLAYVRALGIPTEEFVREMNRKAISIGLEQTVFTEVTGLDTGNISTAYEVARLAEYAFTHYPEIAEITQQREYPFVIGGSGREHTIRNTNELVANGEQLVTGSKTGFLYEAGYCLVVRGTDEHAHRIAVVLGSPSKEEHLHDIDRLLKAVIP